MPPSYEASINRTMQGGMPGQQPLEGQYSNFNPNQQMQHNRQQSMPASVASNYSNHLSPPHSNLSSHHVQSPPHSTGAMSPPNMAMSPPQSITMSPPQTSQYSISPPQQTLPVQSSQQHLSSSSPAKSRSVQLPTSPTHLQALRGATHQRHQASFDTAVGGGEMNMNMYRHQQFVYPTPPQEQLHNNSFSPASPDQWSSASPQSNSEWSDGTVHSPPAAMNGNGHYSQTAHHNQLQQQMSQQTDAVII